MKRPGQKAGEWILLAGLALGGSFLLAVTTGSRGVAVTSDTASYFQAAESFSVGDGFLAFYGNEYSEPMTQYAPLYPVCLSAFRFLGVEIAQGARYLAIFLYGLNIFLAALFALYLAGRFRAAFLSAGLLLGFVYFFESHTTALAEPLFFTFMLAALWSLLCYLEKKEYGFLILSACLAGACYMTRYAGFAVIFSGVLALIVWHKDSLFKKVALVSGYLALALAVPAVWTWRNVSLTGWPTGFVPGFSTDAVAGVRALDTISRYFFPVGVPFVARLVATGIVLVVCVMAFKKFWDERASLPQERRYVCAVRIAGMFCGVYMLEVLAWMVLSRGAMALDVRILLPIPVVMMPCLAVFLMKKLDQGINRQGMVLLLVMAGLMLGRTILLAGRYYANGDGYNSRAWADRALVKTIKTFSDHVPVYTNDAPAVYFYTGRAAALIPRLGEEGDARLSWEHMRAQFQQDGAVAVIFNARDFQPSELWWQMVREVPLAVSFRDGWGVVYTGQRSTGRSR